MEKSTKILLISCVILLVVLSLSVGLLIGNKLNSPLVLNTTNNVTPAQSNVNNTTQNTESNQKSEIISSARAISIAKNYAKSYGAGPTGEVGYLSGKGMYHGKDGDPFYHVNLKWIDPNKTEEEDGVAGYVEIDAKTGEINPRG